MPFCDVVGASLVSGAISRLSSKRCYATWRTAVSTRYPKSKILGRCAILILGLTVQMSEKMEISSRKTALFEIVY
jgi:hypothetical protein